MESNPIPKHLPVSFIQPYDAQKRNVLYVKIKPINTKIA
jgi:hypothetical protein